MTADNFTCKHATKKVLIYSEKYGPPLKFSFSCLKVGLKVLNSYQLLAVTSAPPPQPLFWIQYLIFAPPPLTPYTFFKGIPEFETQKLLNFIKFQYLANLCAPDL